MHFETFEHACNPIQPLGNGRLAAVGIVRRKERSDCSLGDQRLGLGAALCEGIQRLEGIGIEVDAELDLFHTDYLQVHTIVGVEADSPRDTLHRPVHRLRLDSIGVSVIGPSVELVLGKRRLNHDLLILRKLWLAAKAAIRVVAPALALCEQVY